MRILNFGSLNIDHVYAVDHFVRPGETLSSAGYRRFSGGKGANQSIALAGAGARVFHAGKLGLDGVWLKKGLARRGVDTRWVDIVDEPSGHAIIQVAPKGENCILLHGGANHSVTARDAERTLARFAAGDFLLLQNEISGIADIMRLGAQRGLHIVFNPAPMHPDVLNYPLDVVHLLIVNEIEGGDLTGETSPRRILAGIRDRYPRAAVALTLGRRGAIYAGADGVVTAPGVNVTPVDTTAAGDTFIGYFLAGLMEDRGPAAALRWACRAAALCVTRPGAADSIPTRAELEAWRYPPATTAHTTRRRRAVKPRGN